MNKKCTEFANQDPKKSPCEKTTIDVPGSGEDHKWRILITTSVERNRSRKHDLLVECRAKWLKQCCYNIFLPSVVLRICGDRKTASSRYGPRLRPFLRPSVAAWHFLSRFIQQQPLPFLLGQRQILHTASRTFLQKELCANQDRKKKC